MQSEETKRVVIRGVKPEVECGRFPIKRVVGDTVRVEAAVFADGHDEISCFLKYRHEAESAWQEVAMESLVNDQWRGTFTPVKLGQYAFTLTAWIDHYKTWRRDLKKRIDGGQDVAVYLPVGSDYLRSAGKRAHGQDAKQLNETAQLLAGISNPDDIINTLDNILGREIDSLMLLYSDRSRETTYKELRVTVERERARFSTWYELFPRSTSPEAGRHGTFRDCARLMPEIAAMGFDIVYFPPIHPIGETHRKGKNNARQCVAGEPGSPWAIGGKEGGHKSIHPELGTLEDFRDLVSTANSHGIELALDLAYQCSPDHPYVKEHPEWFRWRADGTVQYAENPPKKYEDIYPFEFESADWESLWTELKSVVEYWIAQGVRTFRVDNPHTKPFKFWEWMIADLKRQNPDLIFLSEAFTRPNIMYWLAKLGFTQSYTYFTWRNTSAEIQEYLTELTQTEVREYFRPNLWPNTPDILHEYLQHGGRAAFMSRLVLAATLGASYGIYGPAYELFENVPKEPGSEEYLNSEKYEIKQRDLNDPRSLRSFISRVNAIRKENRALQANDGLSFHLADNPQIICYSKRTPDNSNVIVTVVNLDAAYTQAGFIELPLEELGIDIHKPYRVTDLLSYSTFHWQGPRNYVELRPHEIPAHILRLG